MLYAIIFLEKTGGAKVFEEKVQTTMESRAKTKNGVSRLVFVVLSILIEVTLIVLLFTTLSDYAEWLNILLRILGAILVLYIYSEDTTATMKMPWIILILLFPIVGVTIYLLVGLNHGTRKMRERYQAIDAQLFPLLPRSDELITELADTHPNAAGIAHYLQQFANYPLYQHTQVTYYNEAAKGLDAQIKALKMAKHFIFMEYHAIEDKESWQKIEEVLVEKVNEGLEVRVFYDDMGSIGFINTDFVEKMERLGIACRVFNPFMPGLNVFLNNRDHRKITVIDGEIGFTGGYNLANEYFNVTHPYGMWKDTGIKIEGPAVRSLTVAFLEMWNAVKENVQKDENFLRFIPVDEEKQTVFGYVQPYAYTPLTSERVGEEVYISMANKAKRYCYFMTPYLILSDELTHAIALAAKRGVDVRIVTPGIPDKKLVYGVTRSFYPDLVKAGVRIFEWTPGFCHAKMSVVDDEMATCGTINLDYRSLYHHFENGCFMVGNQAVSDIKADFDSIFDECHEVTENYRESRKAHLSIKELFLRFFAELL